MKVIKFCKKCKSEDIFCTAKMKWSNFLQKYIKVNINDDYCCSNCGSKEIGTRYE